MTLHLESAHGPQSRPDGRIPVGLQRLRVGAGPGSRVIHCQPPNGATTILPHEPKTGERPTLRLQVGIP